jgi:Glycosyl hydrolases family 16
VRAGYELEFDDGFEAGRLDPQRWIAHHLPQWSSRERAGARYEFAGGLRLLIEADQPPWCEELDGDVRVSSLQTGVFAGPVGSAVGQHRFHPDAVVREAQEPRRLYTPRYGPIETRLQALADPRVMVAPWMIGYEDAPDRSAEICVCEPHVYAAEWTPDHVAFSVDGEHVKTVGQSPGYPMQLMLGIYEFPGDSPTTPYPKAFAVDFVRGYRPAGSSSRAESASATAASTISTAP